MTEATEWDRLATNKEKRDMLKRQFKLWKHNEDGHLFAEFVLSVLAEVVGRETVRDEVMDMGLYHGDNV
jgi:hypothetical protein